MNNVLENVLIIARHPLVAGLAVGFYTGSFTEGLKIFGIWFLGAAAIAGVVGASKGKEQ